MRRLSLLLSFVASPLSADDFPSPPDTQPLHIPFPTAEESLAKLHLPPGFQATVFASEPDVNNPIACTWDEKGRLWIAENFTYGDSNERYNLQLRDRIIILEDTDNDGVHDKRTVFTDKLQMLTSIERGLGGIWALCPPHLLFIPDADGDDVPDGPPQVMLDGFSTQAASRHTFANGLKWGPDGWLYGRIGISSTSHIGTPGTPEKDRPGTAGGLWRYHPVHKKFDIVCAGTTNPWGHDWNEHGELFFINTVIGHLWHGIHGAHFKRMFGPDLNPRAYQLMDQIADHYHWDTGGVWQDSRDGAPTADALGGGHAHVGMTIYQGTNWPAEYRGKLLTINFGGRRVNVERLEPHGSGYIGRHEPDILKTDDPWFRGIEITCGPDGGVYLLDWSDIGECHDDDGVHRNSGRIFKITHGTPEKPAETDLTRLDDAALASLQTSDNEWLVRMARWELRERVHRGMQPGSLAQPLYQQFQTTPTTAKKLNHWWTLRLLAETAGETSPALEDHLAFMLRDAMESADPHLHAWAVRTLSLWGPGPKHASGKSGEILAKLAARHDSPVLRLALASALGTLPHDQRPILASALLSRAEDANDPNLPLMYWYGIMDLPPAALVPLFSVSHIPLVKQFIARRCAGDLEKNPAPLNELLALAAPGDVPAILQGITDALNGWTKAPEPAAWPDFATRIPPDAPASATDQLLALKVLFGDGRALDDIKRLALDETAEIATRASALRSLITARADGLQEVCEKLLRVRGLGVTALHGLSLFDDPDIGKKICLSYPTFYPAEKSAVLETLVSRREFARELLEHINPRVIPREHLTAAHVQRIQSLHDAGLNKRLEEVWGSLREADGDKKQLMQTLQTRLTPDILAQGDKSSGRVIFHNLCSSCHKLYGEGGDLGPDLTGSGRHDIAYLIGNIVDPGAILANDYKITILAMKDGRTLSGNIAARTERTLTLKMIGIGQTVELGDIEKEEQLPISLMPEGLLSALGDNEVRDLFAYLMHDGQVPLPE